MGTHFARLPLFETFLLHNNDSSTVDFFKSLTFGFLEYAIFGIYAASIFLMGIIIGRTTNLDSPRIPAPITTPTKTKHVSADNVNQVVLRRSPRIRDRQLKRMSGNGYTKLMDKWVDDN